jgi:hydrogenase maturation protease
MKLVIAIGNPLRADDGVGWHVATLLQSSRTDIQVLVRHQLAPELAEDVAHSEAVIFLDARKAGQPGRISVARLKPASPSQSLTHSLAPAQLLGVALALYDRCPPAALLTVSGSNFEFDDQLSPSVQRAIPKLVRQINRLQKR